MIFLQAEVAVKVCGQNLTGGCNQCLGLKAVSPACNKEPVTLSTGAMSPLPVSSAMFSLDDSPKYFFCSGILLSSTSPCVQVSCSAPLPECPAV